MTDSTHKRNPVTNRGFSLIEVLITVFVLSVGLLGLAAMQGISTKNSHSADKRTIVTLYAEEILDRMRANIDNASDYVGTYDTCASAAPSGTDLYQVDLNEWLNRIDQDLPSCITTIAESSGLITLTIQWDDSRGLSGSTTQQFIYETRL
jgi:type IV pilus assembly protein PilV